MKLTTVEPIIHIGKQMDFMTVYLGGYKFLIDVNKSSGKIGVVVKDGEDSEVARFKK